MPRPLARSAVCRKSFVLSSLPIRKGLVLVLVAIFSTAVIAPTTCGFNYLIFNYMSVGVFDRKIWAESGVFDRG